MSGAKFVAEDADRPHIDHVVVLAAHDDFGGDIVEGAAEGASFVAKLGEGYLVSTWMDQPKSANLTTLLMRTMFYGLRSRWMMPWEWR